MKASIAVAAVVTGLLASLSGCSGTMDNAGTRPGETTAGPARSSSPAELFANAVAKTTKQNVSFTVQDKDAAMSGDFDAASGATKVATTVDGLKMEIIGLGNDIYLGGLAPDGKFMHAEVSKFKEEAVPFLILADPLFGLKLLSTAANVKQDQPGSYSGTVDLTKAAMDGAAKRVVEAFAKDAGTSASALPFTATLDESGMLSTVKMTFPKADTGDKDLAYDIKVTKVGGAVTVAAPPKANVTEAPSDIYSGI